MISLGGNRVIEPKWQLLFFLVFLFHKKIGNLHLPSKYSSTGNSPLLCFSPKSLIQFRVFKGERIRFFFKKWLKTWCFYSLASKLGLPFQINIKLKQIKFIWVNTTIIWEKEGSICKSSSPCLWFSNIHRKERLSSSQTSFWTVQ